MDREVLHVLPQQFVIDEQDGIKKPLGMSGVRLEAEVHIVTGAVTSAQNIIKSCNRAGLEVRDLVLQQLASSYAALTEEEKNLGVALIDIGGGTTDIAIFHQGSIWHTSVIPLGGNHVTNDIAVGLRTPPAEAEKIKRRHGCAMAALVRPEESIEVPSVSGRESRTLSRMVLAEIVQPRVEEILELAKKEMEKSGFLEMIPSGVVVTGGSALLEGLPELADQIFDLPVRRGTPRNVGGMVSAIESPVYTTGVGLVLYGMHHRDGRGFGAGAEGGGIFARAAHRARKWFGGFF
jgi:cell division protein FtsA